jgi:hypothetical protein
MIAGYHAAREMRALSEEVMCANVRYDNSVSPVRQVGQKLNDFSGYRKFEPDLDLSPSCMKPARRDDFRQAS